jgi:putative DNA primase/helicase
MSPHNAQNPEDALLWPAEDAQDQAALTVLDGITEHDLANAFTRRYSKDWRYVTAWGRWLVWNGRYWSQDQLQYVLYLARCICTDRARKTTKLALIRKLCSLATISAVERLARSDIQHAATVEEWDADPWLLNTPGGVVNLHSGQLQPHQRAQRITRITQGTPQGNCPLWLGFLAEVSADDPGLQGYLQRLAGYLLTGSTSEHLLFFLHGSGANGKSVFINTLNNILGDYASSAPMESFMESRNDKHPTDLASLRGARFVSAVETEHGRHWAESRIKSLTGGDKISARFMRQDFFEYTPQFKLLISGNHPPAIHHIDEAMRRRLHLIPFTRSIPPAQRDKRLQSKLLAERDGILAWALAGCLDWQARGGLEPPARVRNATTAYFEDENPLERWLAQRCTRAPNDCTLTTALFEDWCQWAITAGEVAGTQRKFSDLLLSHGLEKWRNSTGQRGFSGIGLRPHKQLGPPGETSPAGL